MAKSIQDIEKKIKSVEKAVFDENKMIPYMTLRSAELRHENIEMRMNKVIKYLILLNALTLLILVSTNIAWVVYESQFQEVVTVQEVTQESEGGYNNFIGNNGDIDNGETDCQNNYNY